jgi:large subunit ribosomal protein L7/L12
MASISTKPRGQSARLTIRLGPVRITIDADSALPRSFAKAEHATPSARRRNGNGQFAARAPLATPWNVNRKEEAAAPLATVAVIRHGDRKIEVIKAVRDIAALGLKEAKDPVEDAPLIVKEGIQWFEAEAIKTALENVGAGVSLQSYRSRGNGQHGSMPMESAYAD